MVQCSKTVMEAIDLAMAAEQKASDFYTTAAARVSSARGRQLFLQLSEFEQGHFHSLAKLKDSLAGKGCFISYGGTSFTPISVEGDALEISGEEKKDIADILTMAIKNEKSAGAAYTKLAAEVDDPAGVEMFKRLAEEEAQHARILEDQFYDISNKGMWTWDA
ncbi:MAG: ferritin family protein [Deltaproteobacteria bacterium]|nr:ferritin family protein [Candidatus Anaeroferrophillus wilburensis]MBN2887915.1 ferritin family protein [Deltaproteobacteria bacterium]